MSSADISTDILAWLAGQGWGRAFAEPVAGGTNNSVYRLQLGDKARLLKISTQKHDDPRDRFGAEKEFYDCFEERQIDSVPKRYAFHPSLRVALYEWADGAPVGANAGNRELEAALELLSEVRRRVPPGATRVASEACFALSDHVELIERRIAKLQSDLERRQAAAAFVADELVPIWRDVQERLSGLPEADFASSSGRRLFSPGDFGFHNALRKADDRLVFFDFEYCGWDDPAKTVADIFLQPESPVDFRHWNSFCERIGERLELGQSFGGRAVALRPLFAVKWACILLNALIKNPETAPDTEERQVAKARAVAARGIEGGEGER